MFFEFTQPTMRADWERTGWNRFLPFEAEVLWHVFCDATQWGVDGDIDVLLDWQESMHPVLSPNDPDCRPWRFESRGRRPQRRVMARLLADSGESYPETLDEIAELGVSLGLYRRGLTDDTVRWRVPAALPLPTEVLPMTPRQRRAEDEYRWLQGGAATARGVAELLLDSGEAAESVTSIAHLARCLGRDPASVRRGLEYLCAGSGGRAFMRVYLGDGPRRRRAVSPECLATDDPCIVVPHWRRLWKRYGLMWHLEGRGEFLLRIDSSMPVVDDLCLPSGYAPLEMRPMSPCPLCPRGETYMSTDPSRSGRSRFRRWFTGRTKLSLVAIAVVAAVAVPVGYSFAESRAKNFEVPFPCNQSWEGQTRTNHSPQNAIDFNRSGDLGDRVSSSASGTVTTVRDLGNDSYGKYVVVSHGSGWETLYAHLNSFSVKEGENVSTGEKIGEVGSTGGSTGPHLHYEQRNGGSAVKVEFDGKQAHYWGSKTYKSSNNCSGGGNPYSAAEVCGNGYGKVDSKAIKSSGKTRGTVVLMYNNDNGKNCVVALKATSIGKKTSTSAKLEVKGGSKGADSGKFSYYAGPVRKEAKSTCVKWGGSFGSASWTSNWGHCGG